MCDAAALTDVGMVRELNEDAVMMVEYWRDSQVQPAQNFLYVVADGMGGAEAGEIASAIAVSAIRDYVEGGLGERSPGSVSAAAAGRAGRRPTARSSTIRRDHTGGAGYGFYRR